MALGDEDSDVESIIIPRPLLELAGTTEILPGRSQRSFRQPTPSPGHAIHVPKTRPQTPYSIANDRDPSCYYPPDSFANDQSHIHPTERSLQLHWRDALRQEEGYNLSHSNSRRTTPVLPRSRMSNLPSFYNIANLVNIKHQRRYWSETLIEYGIYALFVLFIYFVLIGVPLWKGAVYWLYWLIDHKFILQGGWAIVVGVLIFYAYIPLLIAFEHDAPGPEYYEQRNIERRAFNTALLIPTYRSAPILGRTLKAALKVFPPQNIYIVANGNSSRPLDNTEDICKVYGVNHIWSPVGSKIIALFVGCYAVKPFRSVLIMDDDCILPENFLVVASRLNDQIRCIGYTIKAVAPGVESTWCQKAQDLEYKLAGLQRCFSAKIGSATFPHGAISLWDRSFLQKTLEHHPGFSISEDWFLGDSCRQIGGRIGMCSATFVETATPTNLFLESDESKRGGFGEMTVFRQRFTRWNFFTTTGVWHNLAYIFGSWKLGKYEAGTKIFVWQEVYETILYLLTPFILPISLFVQPWFCVGMSFAILGLYLLQVIIFNEFHLRLKKERVSMFTVIGYYLPYKVFISFINVGSCYWALFKYGRYFAQRHPKLTEDHKAVGLVLTLEQALHRNQGAGGGVRRNFTVTTVDRLPFRR
ncbi:glycosyl transferase [Aspergillus karnatakaensis]|uniref:glycosyl transferase n=1 Tax=Aspergillus karnatakaensis TaxID=1810916 RepID=UPI003CCE267E